MKKILLGVSLVSLAVFSGCSTKYMEKCNSKTGICERNLTTNSENVAKIAVAQKNCCPKEAKKSVQKLNINVVIKQQSAPTCTNMVDNY